MSYILQGFFSRSKGKRRAVRDDAIEEPVEDQTAGGVVVSLSLGDDLHRMKGYQQDAEVNETDQVMVVENIEEVEGMPRWTIVPDLERDVEPLFVHDEHAISEYIATCVDGILSDESKKQENWKERVEAMSVLERLVLGGAGTYPLFIQEINACHHILENQLMDRRSTVSKQACILISTLMEHCGYSARSLALALQPSLIKLHGISIALVSNGAQECLNFVYEYCHDERLLSHLCSVICTDRSAKLRQGAACQLLRTVEVWEQDIVDHYRVDIEQTILCAISDATPETRKVGRQAFEAYCMRYRENAKRLVDGLHSTVKDPKVRAMMLELFQKGSTHDDHDAVACKPRRKERQSMTTGPQRVVVDQKRMPEQSVVHGAETASSAYFDKKKNNRASLPGGAVRVSTSRVKSKRSAPAQWQHAVQQEESEYMDLASLVNRFYSAGLVWNEKVNCLKRLESLLESNEQSIACSSEVFDMMVDALISEIGDAHYKVSSQAMATLSVAFRNEHVIYNLQHHLEQIIPVLFVKIGDTKESIRNCASEALVTVKETSDADLVLQGLVAATRTCKSVKSQCAIMLYFEDIFSVHKGSSGNAWRTMLAYCLRLATNKNPEVREQALAACARVYHSGKSAAVDAALSGLPKSPRATIKSALDEFAPPTEAVSSLSEAFGLHSVGDHDDDDDDQEEESTSLFMEEYSSDISLAGMCTVQDVEYEEALDDLDKAAQKQEKDDPDSGATTAVWDILSSLREEPSENAFRCLNNVCSSSLASLTDDERRTLGSSIWEAFVLLVSNKSDEGLVCAACSSIISYFSYIPNDIIEPKIDHVLEALIDLGDKNDYELSTIAIAAGIQLTKAADPVDAYSCLGPMLPKENELPPFQGSEARRACNVLKFLRPCLRQIPQAQLAAALELTMPSLCNCFTSPHAEIRHLSLDCIVMIQKSVGVSKTSEFTQSLTKTQQQLIQIQSLK